ncbi:MAG: cytochrome C [Hyphomicrobium sp.]|nr:MAG: cytochrome C [Hyphomicrobium sp.]PPD01999.1 MAG: cytochrome C [Hyphomicrobium sp.]
MSAMFIGATLAASAEPPKADGAGSADGQTAYNNACRTCHSIKEGDHRLGPSLGGIVGKKSGASDYANYSPAMKKGDVTWDEKTLDSFIANPDAVVAGNNMKPYTGISDAGERAKIISYLKSGE